MMENKYFNLTTTTFVNKSCSFNKILLSPKPAHTIWKKEKKKKNRGNFIVENERGKYEN